ncbi:hypothetical protein NQ314_000872 [Rhamnusium bicolor]|uniref:poly(ADP-ribose) glycohydrolase n=1 Tax=Rhamnusium bicolor TaxID=1586634 RepID=A0AAV8ZTM5_9CUCU|nr:hypothetical protein NQ314_000872 [Rhamnusium bicolor]
MALVMLPSDLPWWDSVKRHLIKISNTKNTLALIDGMQKIYEMCNVSLDPDEEIVDPQHFVGLLNFLDNDLTSEERSIFLNKTLPNIVSRALRIKELRPKGGLHFSLQQQPDCTELEYSFVSSLLANAFFSTFPKRTDKSHPTLQNFNFSNFFKNLTSNVQKSKLKSFLYYFEWLENNENSNGKLKIFRQVMSSREWLTIEDWLECSLPLCALKIKHDGKLERSDEECLKICFASAKIGGKVLTNGYTQECINLVTAPELLTILLNVEALEDNEVLTIEKVRHISRISNPKHQANLEKLEAPREVNMKKTTFLRELNKCLLGFQQKQSKNNESQTPPVQTTYNHRRRLSPIGESVGSTQSDPSNIPIITQQSCSTNQSGSASPISDNNNTSTTKLRVKLEMERNLKKRGHINNETLVHNRRGRFIVLGSSGECLPVSRAPLDDEKSIYSSCESSDAEFHSAKTSLDDGSEDENYHKRYSIDLETPERRHTFAQRLKDALKREISVSPVMSSEESYAVGISVTGSGVEDPNISVRRGGSTGFALEDSLDEDFLQNSLQQERQWIDKFKSNMEDYSTRKNKLVLNAKSLSLELARQKHRLAAQLSAEQIESNLQKENVSPSLTNHLISDALNQNSLTKKSRAWFISCVNEAIIQTLEDISVNVSLPQSVQLSEICAQKSKNGLKPVSTGNWGCGSSRKGDVQLKVIIQWLAASVAGVPSLIYYTYGHQQLVKLDTVCRILVDRKWTVKDLAGDFTLFKSSVTGKGTQWNII